MRSDPAKIPSRLRLGENFELDVRSYELRRAGRVLKLERIPMELLLLLVEKQGELVSRDQIIERIWGKDVFLDTDNSINAAVRKIRLVLKDDSLHPRFLQTITGRGYRFIGPVDEAHPASAVVAARPQAPAGRKGLIGQQISHYRILSEIGAGGMGVVYEAEDIRLGRRVALKFLPEELGRDQKALQRFEREARLASSLNHPNICTIYEVEEHDHYPVIVMELLDGQSLKERIREGPISIDELLDFAIQASDAVAAAHARGIIHRDINPGNIFVVGHSRLKILDFGLAKLYTPEAAEDQSGDESLTLDGSILGTASYMSPEQVRGEELDARSDLFSFGVVLYEMATNQRPFAGKNPALIMNAILNEQPAAASNVSPSSPAALDTIIARALEKDLEKRFQSAADICSELKRLKRHRQNDPATVTNIEPVRPSQLRYLSALGQEPAAIQGRFEDRFSEKQAEQLESRRANLPVQRTGFVGREKEVAAAKELLLRNDSRMVTVTGPGGIGKTRLAVQVATSLVERFPGGTHFVPLASLSDPDLIASVIVQTLGIREGGSQSPLEVLKQNLQDSLRAPMLLVLDNFEHLIQAAPTVADLLAISPYLKIMVTSREALHVYGENEFPVPPLMLPDVRSTPSVEALSQYPAVALFVQRAVAVKPDFGLTRENAPAVIEICARLDGLPLAIELAAARVKVLSPSSLLARLASRLQLLTGGSRDLPQRQQTLRAAIDWSYDLLTAPEQKLFRRLSVFVGGCSLEGAEAACDTKGDLDLDLLDGIASMVDKSLVQQMDQADGESRFVMLETIREYGLEKLAASGEQASTRRAHAAYCMVLAEEEPAAKSGEEWLEQFALEHGNFRAALAWLIETGDARWGLRLGAALFRFWEMREYFAEGRDSLGKLLKLPGAAVPNKARACVLFAAGALANGQGDYASADALIGASLEIALQSGDKQGAAVSLNALAINARDRGDLSVARSLLEESLVLWRELDDQKSVARSLSNLANIVKMQGDNAGADSLYGEALSIFRRIGDWTGVAWTMNYQGDVARHQGDAAAARTTYEQSLAIFRELDDRWGIAGTLADLGSLAREQGNFPTANSMYRESMKLFQELGHQRGIARLLEYFACSAAAQLESERSLRLAGVAAALRKNIGAPLTSAEGAKLDASLHSARQALTNAVGDAAWLGGWDTPVEKAIEEVLVPESESPSDPQTTSWTR
jgi:predicted ATPase/DNA-binding winged helix-turn-helix (wHTH) protein/tRNA A-37 threonylcarbamoyl transferase component Bud32/predicted negative regulator of RcsB-dependent stress response